MIIFFTTTWTLNIWFIDWPTRWLTHSFIHGMNCGFVLIHSLFLSFSCCGPPRCWSNKEPVRISINRCSEDSPLNKRVEFVRFLIFWGLRAAPHWNVSMRIIRWNNTRHSPNFLISAYWTSTRWSECTAPSGWNVASLNRKRLTSCADYCHPSAQIDTCFPKFNIFVRK